MATQPYHPTPLTPANGRWDDDDTGDDDEDFEAEEEEDEVDSDFDEEEEVEGNAEVEVVDNEVIDVDAYFPDDKDVDSLAAEPMEEGDEDGAAGAGGMGPPLVGFQLAAVPYNQLAQQQQQQAQQAQQAQQQAEEADEGT